jgi:tetratricopeptide (TPR) repeat protein
MKKLPTDPLTPETAREICLRDGIPFWITGEIVRSGRRFGITISVIDAQSGDVRALETLSLSRAEDLISRMGSAILELRRRLGEPESLIQQNRQPLEQVTTSSLQALHRFAQALDLHAQGKIELAVEALETAVRLDPQFAAAYSRLAIYTGGTGDYERAFKAAGQAYALRNRVSERERYQISATYHLDCMQYEEALKDFQQAVILDPENGDAYRQIALLQANLGEAHAGVEPARKARDLPPPNVINEGVLVLLLAQSDQLQEALQELTRARTRFGDETYLHWVEGIIWQVKGDSRRAQEAFRALAEGDTTYESHGRILLAQSLMMDGRLQEAAALLESGFALDNRQHFARNEAIGDYLLAKAHALLGDTSEASRYLSRIESLPDLPIHLKMMRAAAVLSVETGDVNVAQRLLRRVERLRDLYPSALSRGAVAHIRGEIELAHGDFKRARQSLEEANRYWEDPRALRSLGRLWLAQDRCDRAIPVLKRIESLKARIVGDFFSSWVDWLQARRDLEACQASVKTRLRPSISEDDREASSRLPSKTKGEKR